MSNNTKIFLLESIPKNTFPAVLIWAEDESTARTHAGNFGVDEKDDEEKSTPKNPSDLSQYLDAHQARCTELKEGVDYKYIAIEPDIIKIKGEDKTKNEVLTEDNLQIEYKNKKYSLSKNVPENLK